MIFLDHNGSTPLDPRVREVMLPALELGNPSSSHAMGRAARAALDGARREVAALLRCEPGEVVFTASGSEANALALKGAFLAHRSRSPRVLLSAVEHPSIRESAKQLVPLGAEVVELPVDRQGRVDLDAAERELSRGASVLAVMWVNNETGVVQPVGELAALARKAGVPYLCDAVQVPGKLPLAVHGDVMSLSAHKFHGPHGSGLLFVRRGLELVGLVGGHQERGRRGGTENVAAAVGLARALRLAVDGLEVDAPQIRALRDRFETRLLQALPSARINAAGAERAGNTSSVLFPGCDGEALLIGLDLQGICASLGAACASGALSPSHVLLAMGATPADARASLRFSLGRGNTEAELDRVVAVLTELVLRSKAQ